MAAPTTRHLTILLTDIKGFTDKTSAKSRADIQAMLDEHRAVVLPILQEHGGNLVKTIGDAFLMSFDSPTNAVLAGVAVQEALRKRNEGRAADDRLEIRIAINAGEVNLADNDVFGEAVNITARIEGLAEAGQVWFTEAVYLAMNKNEVPSSEIGLMQLKGIPEKIRVYKVRREEPLGASSSEAVKAVTGLSAFMPRPKAAPVAGTAPVPSTWKRFAALCVDGLIVGALVSSISGDKPRAHIRKKYSKGQVNVDLPASFIKKTGAPMPNMNVADGEGNKVVFDDKKGLQVTVDDDGSEDSEHGRRDWLFALCWFIYSLIFLKRWGATPGKKLLKLKVVSIDGSPLDEKQRAMRAAISLISGYAAGIGYLWAFFEPQRRGWHDLLADTRVVSAE
ncbi:MAG: RDD family protein [Elusimicrobia bacterium]|nr:RDD family protein [Elusimicrobiota bacterium]